MIKSILRMASWLEGQQKSQNQSNYETWISKSGCKQRIEFRCTMSSIINY